jgi:hypothetical protein
VDEPSTLTSPPPRAACARCGAVFGCDPVGDCWCKHEDIRLPMPTAGATCLCPDCLRAAAAAGEASAL